MKRSPISPMSTKRRAKIAADRPARLAHLRAFPYCEAKAAGAPGECFGALHIHEPLTRARGGDPGDPENMKTCCDWHNDAIGQVPEVKAWAEAAGFLKRDTVPDPDGRTSYIDHPCRCSCHADPPQQEVES